MAVAAALGSLGAVALGTFVVSLLLRWLWDALVAVTRFRATCRQLNKFPTPPWRNWLLGHTGMVRGQQVAPAGAAGTEVEAPAKEQWGHGGGTCEETEGMRRWHLGGQ